MATSMLCEKRALALLLVAQFVSLAAQLGLAEEQALHHSRQIDGSAAAARLDSLMLGFTLAKDSGGRLWANYYIHNRGKSGLLMCDAMELSFSVSTADGKSQFPLYEASNDFNPMAYFLLDPPPPGRAMSGCTVLTRHARVSAIFLRELTGLQELCRDRMKDAKLVGRVKGALLMWSVAEREYVRMPFDISSGPNSWEKFAHLFATPVSSRKDSHEGAKPVSRGSGGATGVSGTRKEPAEPSSGDGKTLHKRAP